jgi:tRNA U34 5-methylaminomethyl-2-thiouridine-forming methyltransferase MnmC
VLLPSAGVIGYRYRPLSEVSFRLPGDGVDVLFSDGINARVDPIEGSRTSLEATTERLLERFAKPAADAGLIVFAHRSCLRFAGLGISTAPGAPARSSGKSP